jgi:hypothetical protein
MLAHAARGAAEAAAGVVEKPGAAAGAVALATVVGGTVSATPVGAVRLAERHAVDRVVKNVVAPAPVDSALMEEASVVEDAAVAVATENPTETPAACRRRRVDAS